MSRTTTDLPHPLTQVQGVIATTASAWNISRENPRALARRAARGDVPARVLRRLRASLPVVPQAFCW